MAHLANVQQRVRLTSSRALTAVLLMLCTVLAGGLLVGPGNAAADPALSGCTTDTSVTNQLTLTCEPGAGDGAHAFIRCRDILGMPHTHIGPTIGRDGGGSTAVCALAENGPV
ncbi:hypothetical protein [Nocardia altamirensis]|uniref:hypothetical protein n=1 Tax=Nocardia altamirensis TaxID=472158 RepID=UPI001FE1EF73|nr:hypothetical protein [Nocardia altamirensis]